MIENAPDSHCYAFIAVGVVAQALLRRPGQDNVTEVNVNR